MRFLPICFFLSTSVLLSSHTSAQAAVATGTDTTDVAEVVVNGQQNVSKWFRAESQHFIIYSDTKREDVSQLLSKLERYDYLLRLYTKAKSKVENEPKLTLYYHADIDDLDLINKDQPNYAIGLYNSCAMGVQGFSAHMYYRAKASLALEKQPENEGLTYIFEAYARHFLYHHTDLRIPTWYIDGFAQYFAGTRFSDTETIIGMAPASIGEYLSFLSSGHRYSLNYEDILLQNDSDGRNYAGVAGVKLEFQAKSWILTHYILSSSENIQNFRRYIGFIMQDIEPTKAFEEAFGYKIKKLSNVLWKYKYQSAQALKLNLTAGKVQDIRFSALPVAANNLILVDATLKSCPPPKLGASLLQKAQAEAQKHPHSDYAKFTLSRAQIDWGNPQDTIAFLTSKTKDNNYDAFYLLGLAQLRLSEQSQDELQKTHLDNAQRNLLRACALDPQSAEAFYAYFKAAVRAQAAPSEEVLGSAILAWKLQPEVNSFVRSVALIYAYLNRIPDAQHALGLLSHNSRDPQMAAWAKQWQSRITSASKAELLAEMRAEPLVNGRFTEWTIASDEVMKAVELASGLEAAQNSLPDQSLQNQQMPDQGGFNSRR